MSSTLICGEGYVSCRVPLFMHSLLVSLFYLTNKTCFVSIFWLSEKKLDTGKDSVTIFMSAKPGWLNNCYLQCFAN